ncbi:hypothetical protein OH77DRAFT_725171 [Trametes cingulata]|nr:hypothetical protein OH77DRAFT_725171 [Trametes cingulata]
MSPFVCRAVGLSRTRSHGGRHTPSCVIDRPSNVRLLPTPPPRFYSLRLDRPRSTSVYFDFHSTACRVYIAPHPQYNPALLSLTDPFRRILTHLRMLHHHRSGMAPSL